MASTRRNSRRCQHMILSYRQFADLAPFGVYPWEYQKVLQGEFSTLVQFAYRSSQLPSRPISHLIPTCSMTSVFPRLSSQMQTYTTAFNSLDDLIREWQLLYHSLEENASHPWRDAKPDLVKRKPMTYPLEDAAHSWSREVPHFD